MTGSAPHAHALRGILLILLAVLIFSLTDTAAKHVMTIYGVPLVATIRYGINLVLVVLVMMPKHGVRLWRTQRTNLVMLRGVALAVASMFAGFAFQRMPVGEAVSVFYLQGFLVLIAAGYVLKERISLIAWIAAAAGFAGVLLIARPGGGLDPLGIVFALGCAGISTIYILLSRFLAKTESTMAMLFHVAVAGFILFGMALAFNWRAHSVTLADAALMAFIGVGSLVAHFLLTIAYRLAPASLLAPFNYFQIGFAVIAGWVVYAHVPDRWALTGMAMIAASGAVVALHTHYERRASGAG